jgi:hypothetical protein
MAEEESSGNARGERLAYLRGSLACSACVLPIHVSTYVLMMGVHSIMSPILLV